MNKFARIAPVFILSLFLPMILLSMGGPAYARPKETNFILADGTVSGTSNIQRNGALYTFTGNITGSLTVEKDNVVIDGAGFTLEGGNRGIVLAQRQNVTVKNTRLTLEGGYVFDLTNASDCVIVGNSLIGTPQPIPGLPLPQPHARLIGPIGLNFLFSMNNTIRDNNMTNGFYAFTLQSSEKNVIIGNNITDSVVGFDIQNAQGNILRNNRADNCDQGISVRAYSGYNFDNDVDASNTVDGKPIYYWLNVNGGIVPSDAAYIVLVNCTNIVVQNTNPQGIMLGFSSNSTLTKVNMAGRGDGINMLGCSGISILDCDLRDGAIAIDIENSSNNTISGNDISNFITRGISMGNASNNIIVGNRFFNCSPAIAPFQDSVSLGNLVISNNFTDNGRAITVQGNMEIQNNTFVGNLQAILCYSGANTIMGNTFTGNGQGVILQSTGNVLKNNRFDGNNDSLPINGANFDNDIDPSNTLSGKPMCYWVNQHNQTVSSDAGFVALVNCSGITVQGLTLTNQPQGILLAFTTDANVTGNLIANNTNGIYLYASSNNYFIGNNVTGNYYAVYISGGTVAFLGGPMSYTPSSGNIFHHNNFVGNNQTLYDLAGVYAVGSPPSENIWDDGAEGNYWSNYTGADANGDGIGDSVFIVYARNTDNHPLMQAVPVEIIPELPAWAILPLFAIAAFFALVFKKNLFPKSRGAQKP